MDRIEIKGLRAFGWHGVFPEEREQGQTFVVDLRLELDLDRAVRSDDLLDTVDYGLIAEQVASAVRETRFDLIEALAGHLLDLAMADQRVQSAEVRIAKPDAPMTCELDEVAVTVRRRRQPEP